ncbi:MAG: LPP20 family lipoprotein [Deltaproteobacteria bacterium]|nr:LPP20 family lipoprotein [Deltaproteobacteria bacterium]
MDVPDWVYQIPKMAGKVCATGAVDPTFYRQDGRVNAAEAARNELARSIQVHISSIMYDTETSRGGSVQNYIVSEVVTAVNEGVLAGAEILSYWFDGTGAVSRTGMTYALACMDINQSVSDLADKLEAAYPGEEHKNEIAAVKERARVAFDELEAMEERRAAQAAPAPAPAPRTPANDDPVDGSAPSHADSGDQP